jgi:hypothetical protein
MAAASGVCQDQGSFRRKQDNRIWIVVITQIAIGIGIGIAIEIEKKWGPGHANGMLTDLRSTVEN